MKILVTGGAGFIGSNTINSLLARGGCEVICVDDFNDYYDPSIKEKNIESFLTNPRFKLYRADICDMKKMDEVFSKEKPDKVIHLAARAGVRESIKKPSLYVNVNVNGTVNMLELAKKYNIKNFVFASSSSVYGNQKKLPFSENDPAAKSVSVYAATKKTGEDIAHLYHRMFGINITCLRFFTVYGPAGRPDMAPYKFVRLILNGEQIPKYGDGFSKRDYTYVEDVVAGILAALDKNLPYEIINLGNSETVSLNDFISLIEKLTGKKAKVKKMPMQPGDVLITYADIAKAKKLLGYKPKTSFEQGMKRFIEWYKKDKIVVETKIGFVYKKLVQEQKMCSR